MTSVKHVLIALVVMGMISTAIFTVLVDVTTNYGETSGDLITLENEETTANLIEEMEETFRESGAEMEEAGESDIGIFKAGVAVTTLMFSSLDMAKDAIFNIGKLLFTPGFIMAGVIVIVAITIFFYIFGIFFSGASK